MAPRTPKTSALPQSAARPATGASAMGVMGGAPSRNGSRSGLPTAGPKVRDAIAPGPAVGVAP
jgi:hypothetical protein